MKRWITSERHGIFPIALQIDKEWIKQWLLSDEYKEFLETWCGPVHDMDSEYEGKLGKCNGCSVGGSCRKKIKYGEITYND